MDFSKIKENMRQREIAMYVYEFIRDTIEAENFQDPTRFVRELANILEEKHLRTSAVNSNVMSVDDARQFEKQLMPYGEFYGKTIRDVPLDRLQWYADQTFNDDLRRYLKSRIIQQEIELEERYRRANG